MKRVHIHLIPFLFAIFLSPYSILGQADMPNIDSLKQALNNSKEDTLRINTLNNLSYNLAVIGDYDSAFYYAEAAKELSERLIFKGGLATSLNNLGYIFNSRGAYSEAFQYSFKSLKIREEISDKPGMASSLSQIGTIFFGKGDYHSSLEYHLKSLKISEEIGDSARMALSLNKIGNVYYSKGDFQPALDFSFKSLKLYKEITDTIGIADPYNNIGNIYSSQGDFPKALEYYFKSLTIKEKIGNKRGLAVAYNNIGNIYGYQKSYPLALKYYLRALKLKEELGDRKGISLVYGNIGDIFISMGNYQEALNYSTKAIKIAEEIGDKRRIAFSLDNIGTIYAKQKRYAEALEFYQKALQVAEEIGIKKFLANTLKNIGNVYFIQKDYQKALFFCKKGLAISNEIGALDNIQQVEKSLNEIYEQMGDEKKALEHYKKYILIRDSIYNQENTKKLIRNEMNFEFAKKEAAEKIEQEKREALAEAEINKQKILRNLFIAGLIIALVLAYLILNRYNTKQRLNTELNVKNQLIESQREKMIDSINYAKDIQQSLLVEESEVQKLLPEAFIYYKPKDIVSGDFYWMSSINGKTIIAAIDCTGHGVPGAFMSMIGNTLLNQIVNEKKITKPSEILKQLHENVFTLLHQEQKHSRSQDGMDVAICSIDTATNEVQFAGAKNPMWIVQNNNLEIFKGDIYSIGGSQLLKDKKLHAKWWNDYSVRVEPGGCIYLFTDGYMDQFGGEGRKKIGSQRFGELLLANHQREMKKQKILIRDFFQQWKGRNAQIDDVLVMGIRL